MSFRNDLIDQIEEIYSGGQEGSDKVDNAIMQVMGWSYQDIQDIDDSDPDEGFYANFNTRELQLILDAIQESEGPRYTITLKVTAYEESVLKRAMEDYSDPSFTRDFGMSNAAKRILRQL